MATTTGYLVRSSGAGDYSPLIGRLHESLAQVSIRHILAAVAMIYA
jgi:hypothetical protein